MDGFYLHLTGLPHFHNRMIDRKPFLSELNLKTKCSRSSVSERKIPYYIILGCSIDTFCTNLTPRASLVRLLMVFCVQGMILALHQTLVVWKAPLHFVCIYKIRKIN